MWNFFNSIFILEVFHFSKEENGTFIWLLGCLPICPSVCLSVYLSVCPCPVGRFVHPSVKTVFISKIEVYGPLKVSKIQASNSTQSKDMAISVTYFEACKFFSYENASKSVLEERLYMVSALFFEWSVWGVKGEAQLLFASVPKYIKLVEVSCWIFCQLYWALRAGVLIALGWFLVIYSLIAYFVQMLEFW